MANYNCTDASDNTYGSGGYGTCTTATQANTSVGAPNTGVFEQILGGGSFTILVPLVVAVIAVAASAVIMKLRKKSD